MAWINEVLLQDVAFGPGTITTQDIGSVSTPGQNGGSLITGTPTPGSFVMRAISNMGTARIQVSGSWSGSLIMEFSVDGGVTWISAAFQVNGTLYTVGGITGSGIFMGDASGCTNFRVRATAWTSGTANIVGMFSGSSGVVKINNAIRMMDNITGSLLSIIAGRAQVDANVSGLPAGLATSANQATEIGGLAAILAKLIAAPATEGKQDTGNTSLAAIAGKDFATQTTLAALLAKLIAAPATEAKQDTGNTSLAAIAGKDFATQTTLAAVLAKLIAAPATEAKQDTGNTSLAAIAGKDFATQTTLAAVLAKLITAPATEGKQDTGNTSLAAIAGKDFATQVTLAAFLAANHTDLAAILAKQPADPSTGAKQDTGNSALATIAGKDFATQATLAAVLAKLIAAPATEAKQDTGNTSLAALAALIVSGAFKISVADAVDVCQGAIADAIVAAGATGSVSAKLRRVTQGLEDLKTTIVLAAGTNAIGKLAANSGVVIGDVNILPAVLTKGTQGANGVTTQDLKDAGRTAVIFYVTGQASGATGIETLLTFTLIKANVASANQTTYTITSGKRLRIQSKLYGSRGNVTATAQVTTFSERVNTAGAVLVNSTPVIGQARSGTAATSLAYDRVQAPVPDGQEIAGDGTLSIGFTANSVFVTNAPTWDMWVIGYEY